MSEETKTPPVAPLALRQAADADVAALTVLWFEGWCEGHAAIVPAALLEHRDVESFRIRLQRDIRSFFVAEREGDVAGFIRIVGEELDQFYVAPALIGSGVAGPLLAAAEDLMRGRGVSAAFLIAAVGNDRALRFYEKHGWTNCGPRMDTVATVDGTFRVNVVRFEKHLS